MSQVPYRHVAYTLLAAHDVNASIFTTPEVKTWQPDPSLSLEMALPTPWDPEYQQRYQQNFQPVKFWRNANMIANYLQTAPEEVDRQKALDILRRLIGRLQQFTLTGNDIAWIENRFDFSQPGVEIPGPWYSAIANAFGILGLRRCLDALADEDENESTALRFMIRQLANAYRAPFFEKKGGPDRWISYITKDGYLWFEEYPMPGGRANIVLNGHIFALLALNEARSLWPENGFATLISAGALSVAENFPAFARRGKTNLYSLRGTRKGDYMPVRTVRQQFELFLLTGDSRFLTFAIRTIADISLSVDPVYLRRNVDFSLKMIDKRLRFDDRIRRRRYQDGAEPGPLQPIFAKPATPPM